MSTAIWKLEKDLCRCCHAEGSFKNLSEPCFQLGQEEIYSEMLQECLDVKIVPITGSLEDVAYTICESCVVRLRDATNFKKQVLDCEERFKDMYSRNLIRGFEVKDEPLEPLLSDSEDLKEEVHSMDDDDGLFLKFDDGDDPAGSDRSAAEDSKGKAKGKAKAKPKTKAKTPKKTKAKKNIKVEETEEITEAAVSGEKKKDTLELNIIPYVSVIEEDGRQLYFCHKCNLKIKLSKHHIKQHILKRHKDLKKTCSICDENFKTFAEKKLHLLKEHNLEEIGKGSNKRLREKPTYYCSVCQKAYKNKRGYEFHMSYFHTLKKCPDCPVMHPVKSLLIHRNNAHGTPVPTCGICGYKNAYEDRVVLHQRRVHLKEKTVPCHVCNLSFFNQKMLKRHLIKHNPDRIYACSYCHKKYPRKSTLQVHEKIHKGEKNKVCSLCGDRFVQKASLNYHMMKHHPDAC